MTADVAAILHAPLLLAAWAMFQHRAAGWAIVNMLCAIWVLVLVETVFKDLRGLVVFVVLVGPMIEELTKAAMAPLYSTRIAAFAFGMVWGGFELLNKLPRLYSACSVSGGVPVNACPDLERAVQIALTPFVHLLAALIVQAGFSGGWVWRAIGAAIALHAATNLLAVWYEQGVFDGPGAVLLRAAVLLAVAAALFWPRAAAAAAPPAPSA